MTSFINDKPLISVITPVYNGAEYLDELIQSVLQQNYPYIEHIIIDDGSNDNGATVAVLKKYSHLRWWSRENKGQYATLNEGLTSAKGDIVSIICADDGYFSVNTFQDVVNYWQMQSDCDGVYGRTVVMNSESVADTVALYPTLVAGSKLSRLIRHTPIFIQHCSLFVSRSLIIGQNIYFDTKYRYAGDWDWLIRLAQAGNLIYTPQPVSKYREHSGQLSQQSRYKLRQESRAILQQYQGSYAVFQILVFHHRLTKSLAILRKQGLKELLAKIKNWY
jgi:glycosyltransferase involved in cell wall biosynthesis